MAAARGMTTAKGWPVPEARVLRTFHLSDVNQVDSRSSKDTYGWDTHSCVASWRDSPSRKRYNEESV